MSIFAISFRIHEDATYAERYESLVKSIEAHSRGKYWDETTSFMLIEAATATNNLANGIVQMSSFAGGRDLMLVINLSQPEYFAIGKISDRDLNVLMDRR
jgi:hypothetical protein